MASRLRKRSLPKRRPAPSPKLPNIENKGEESLSTKPCSSSPRKSARLSGKTEAFSELVRSINFAPKGNVETETETAEKKPRVRTAKVPNQRKPTSIGTSYSHHHIFGKTQTEILPDVMSSLEESDRDKLEEICGELNVELVENEKVYQLEGLWSTLYTVKLALQQMFQTRMKNTPKTDDPCAPHSVNISDMGEAEHSNEDTNNTQSQGIELSSVDTTGGSSPKKVTENIQDSAQEISKSQDGSTCTQPGKECLNSDMVPEKNPNTNSLPIPVIENKQTLTQDDKLKSSGDANMKTKVDDKKLCHICGKNIISLRRHNCQAPQKPKAGQEPDIGEFSEVQGESTSGYTVFKNNDGFKWYQCKSCPMICTRRHRMVIHIKTSHTKDTDVPFNLVERAHTERKLTNEPSTTTQATPNIVENTESKIPHENVTVMIEAGPFLGNTNDGEGMQGQVENVLGQEEGVSYNNDVTINLKLSTVIPRLEDRDKATEECTKCGYRSSREGMRHHVQTRHSKYIFSCKICNKLYPKLFLLRSHYKKQHGTEAPERFFICDKCGRNFKRKVDLVHHKTMGKGCSDNSEETDGYDPVFDGEKYRCGLCPYKAKLRTHVVNHHARKHAPKQFACDQCSTMFAFERELQKHKDVSHSSEKVHVCDICHKSFAALKYLTAHRLRHDNVKKHFCPICNKGFLERFRLTNHIETHKNKSERMKTYKCEICSKVFSSLPYLKDHENIHSGNEPYSCDICGKRMKLQSSAWKHMQLHRKGKSFVCPYISCKKKFSFKWALKAHMATHTGEGRSKCQNCGKVYSQKHALLKHNCTQNTQDIEVPESVPPIVEKVPEHVTSPQEVYMCTECNKIYSEWSQVEAHMQWHTSVNGNVERVPEDTNIEENTEEVSVEVKTTTTQSQQEEIVQANTSNSFSIDNGDATETNQTRVYSIVMNSDGNEGLTFQVDPTSNVVTENVVIQSVEMDFETAGEETQDPSNQQTLEALGGYAETEQMISDEAMDIGMDVDAYTSVVDSTDNTLMESTTISVDRDSVNAPVITIVNPSQSADMNQENVLIGQLEKDEIMLAQC